MMYEASAWESALAFVFAHEGGYSNDPDDPGKQTYMGVTQATYDEWRVSAWNLPARDVMLMEPREAVAIYHDGYWRAAGCDRLAEHGRPVLALAVFDAAVNEGTKTAVELLQHALRVPVDGVVGPVTLTAAGLREERGSVAALLDWRADEYRQLTERIKRLAKWLPGWLARCRWVARAAGVPVAVVDPGVTAGH